MADETPHVAPVHTPTGSLAPAYFDTLYAADADPWRFATSPYEAAKYAATLAALPRERYASALEIGCSIGVLTERLAPRCARLLSIDVSEAALAQARARCATLPQVTFERRELPREFPGDRFDLVLVSEVGYYWSEADLHDARAKIADALAPGGDLLLVHWTGPTHYPLTADAVHEAFLALAPARWTHLAADRRPEYRLDLFRAR